MPRPPLATTISSLLVCSMIVTPSLAFAAGSVGGCAPSESVRRAEYQARGEEAIANGDEMMKIKDYDRAREFYKNACDIVPNAPLSQHLYDKALHKFCNASCDLAEQRITEGRYEDAKNICKQVIDQRYDPRYKRAVVILARLEQPDYYNKTIGPQFRANVEQVKQLFIEAQGFFDSGRFDLANKRCDQILALDKYNLSARKMQEKIDRAESDYGVAGYNETRADAMKRLDLAWAKPVRRYEINKGMAIVEADSQVANRTERIQRKLDSIIIPKLEFKEATIREAVDYLKKKSIDLDVTSAPGDKGVNIVLKLDTGGPSVAPAEAPAPAATAIPGLEPIPGAPGAAPVVPAAGAPAGIAGNPADTRITVSLTNIPLIEALRYVTNLASLKFKVEPYAVFVVPQSVNTDVLLTKEWKIRPDLIPRGNGGGPEAPSLTAPTPKGGAANDTTKGGASIADRESAKSWLISNGVQFNGQASAVYLPGSSRLIVRNTQEQLDLIDTIISSNQNGSAPPQIEIEAKFVEIQQTNLKELSFDWTLGQAHVPGQNNVFIGGGTNTGVASSFPFVDGSGNIVGSNQLTGNNRSGGTAISANAIDALLFGSPAATATPAVAAIAGVFTDPQFQVVIRALNQKKGVDLLSAPRVTTKSGQRAVVEVIQEFRYPTEFQPPQIPQTASSTGGIALPGVGAAAPSSTFPVTPTTPTAFETRNTGVTLEVEPTIGPDNFTIDLNLVPQVVEFEGFINYGSPIQTTSTNPLTGITTTNVITPNVINQPIFSTRKVTTSVSVFDGSTVILGGLIREDVQKVEDKVPGLGDIPILGRLFRSSVDQHIKVNLVMFVTARLMNPAGDPIRAEDDKEEVVETLAPPELPKELPPLMPK